MLNLEHLSLPWENYSIVPIQVQYPLSTNFKILDVLKNVLFVTPPHTQTNIHLVVKFQNLFIFIYTIYCEFQIKIYLIWLLCFMAFQLFEGNQRHSCRRTVVLLFNT